MKLLENVRGAKTSDVTIVTMMEWGKRIGKWCILVGNCPGFVGNRMVNLYALSTLFTDQIFSRTERVLHYSFEELRSRVVFNTPFCFPVE